MTDPNILLSNFRNAMAAGHHNVALLSAASMDEHLTKGGALPDAWDHSVQLDRWLLTVVTDGEHETSTHVTEQSAWLYLIEENRGDIAEWLDPDVLSYDDAKAAAAVDGLFDSEKMNDVREALAEAGINVYVDEL